MFFFFIQRDDVRLYASLLCFCNLNNNKKKIGTCFELLLLYCFFSVVGIQFCKTGKCLSVYTHYTRSPPLLERTVLCYRRITARRHLFFFFCFHRDYFFTIMMYISEIVSLLALIQYPSHCIPQRPFSLFFKKKISQ